MGGHKPKIMEEITVRSFDVYDKTLGRNIVENLKTFEEAESYIIAHDEKRHAEWSMLFYQDPNRAGKFKRHIYHIFHSEAKLISYADDLDNMSFDDMCEEAAGWRAISVVEFKF